MVPLTMHYPKRRLNGPFFIRTFFVLGLISPQSLLGGATARILVGAGDIVSCNLDKAEATAKLVDKISGTVFTAGDNAYANGTAQEFIECYGLSWGRHRQRTRPSPGNHDYDSA